MRKQVKQQIVELLSTVEGSLGYIAGTGLEDAFTILNDCYGAAYSVIDALGSPPPGTELAGIRHQLEEFAALLEQANTQLQQEQKIEKQLAAAQDKIKQAIRLVEKAAVTVLVAFFPYKVSMWDSLESIWQAAAEDPGCEVVVVPIPYHEKFANGRLGRLRYEGELFPPEVPVVHYRDFDLDACRPEVAYIHNVYDEHNMITTVAPAYYSANLKKYVHTLVYVPYYVNVNPSDYYMIALAARSSADILAAVNEKDAARYRQVSKTKAVICAGSPKTDRTWRLETHKPEIPPEWRQKVQGKKVFLLNTSIQSFLFYEAQYLYKLEAALHFFLQQQDAVLWWRPHPLLDATLSAMDPELVGRYRQICNQYVQAGGVYDDSWDAGRAIALADAYIGDENSSLVYMFAITGKPVYVFDWPLTGGITPMPEETTEDLRVQVFGCSVQTQSGSVGFSAYRNALCRFDTTTGSCEDLLTVTEENPWGQNLFTCVVQVDGKTVLAPDYGSHIVIADTENRSYRALPLPQKGTRPPKLNIGFAYGGKAWFVEQTTGTVICCDVKTGEISTHNQHMEKINRPLETSAYPLAALGACVVGSAFYLPFVDAALVLAFDMEKGKGRLHPVGQGVDGFWDIKHDGNDFWLCSGRLLAQDGGREALVRWNPKTGKTDYYSNFPAGFMPRKGYWAQAQPAFSSLVLLQGGILAMPCSANMAVKLNPETGEMEEFDLGLDFDFTTRKSEFYRQSYHFRGLQEQDDTVTFVAGYDDRCLTYCRKTGKLLYQNRFMAPIPAGDDYPWRRIKRGWKYAQGVRYPLSCFVQDVASGRVPAVDKTQQQVECARIPHCDGTSGSAIHKQVMALAGTQKKGRV